MKGRLKIGFTGLGVYTLFLKFVLFCLGWFDFFSGEFLEESLSVSETGFTVKGDYGISAIGGNFFSELLSWWFLVGGLKGRSDLGISP